MKVHIFGASGSGVTTLGLELSNILNCPYFDSDDYYWEPSEPPFTIRRNPEERNQRLDADLAAHQHWILGGSIINWGDKWLSAFDLVVFLWIPPAVRIARLKQREYARYGDVIFTDQVRNQQYIEFIDWASGYDDDTARGRTLAAHENWLKKLTSLVLELRGDTSVAHRVETVLQALNSKAGFLVGH